MNINFITFFFQGVSLGLLLAIPIGPVGFLCIQRSLRYGRLIGFVSALGVAAADAVCAAIAVFSLNFGYVFLINNQNIIKFFGGLFLLVLGIRNLFHSVTINLNSTLERVSIFNTYISAFLITLANPITILLFLGIFSGLDLRAEQSSLGRIVLVSGVFTGSLIWFSSLTSIVAFLRSKFSESYLKYLNIISSLILIAFGLYSIFKSIK